MVKDTDIDFTFCGIVYRNNQNAALSNFCNAHSQLICDNMLTQYDSKIFGLMFATKGICYV